MPRIKKLTVLDYLVDKYDDGSTEFKKLIIRLNKTWSGEFAIGWLTAHVTMDSNNIIIPDERVQDYSQFISEQVREFVEGIKVGA